LKTLKTHIPNYQPSRREFNIIQELGEGNYSRVVAVQHVVTKEYFALKIIEKKRCEDLAKRQHPNVWNEVEMEKKILGERLWNEEEEDEHGKKKYSWCKRIVHLYHTFQDYGYVNTKFFCSK
jgi:serine/threonine protein kinase